MLNRWCLIGSLVLLVGGVLVLFAPNALRKLNAVLTHRLLDMDEQLMRYRYVVGLLMLLVSYALVRLSLLLRG